MLIDDYRCEQCLSPPPEIRERGFKDAMAFLYRVYEAQRTLVLTLLALLVQKYRN
jgi:hypothetical protein